MRPILYPFLWAIAPILALAAENTDRGTLPSDLRIPVLLASMVALVGLLIGRIVTRERDRQALVALTTVVLFSAYGPARALFPESIAVDPAVRMSLILGILLTIGVVAVRWIRRTRHPLAGASAFLFVFGLAVVVLFGVRFMMGSRAGAASEGSPAPVASEPGIDAADAPDIWLIVLDGYTGEEALRSQYGLDNSPFLDSLRAMGFQVAENSQTNYVLTVLSLGAMLNWEYLHDPEGRLQDPRPAEERLEDNRTVLELKGMGYEFVFFRSSFPSLRSNEHADLQLPDRLVGEFTTYWLGTTVLYPISYLLCELRGCEDMGPFLPESPNDMRERVAALIELADRPGPKFVFAHFLLPHGPFRLDSACGMMDPVWPDLDSTTGRETARSLYADQVRCANLIALDLVEGIVVNSPTPPVILLQGDHGYGMFEGDHPVPLEQARTEQIEDRVGVLGAYRLPGAGSVLWPGISPVNVFRVLFNVYFDRDLAPLPDRSFWSYWDDPYDLVELQVEDVRERHDP
jgi:hypothetical protein